MKQEAKELIETYNNKLKILKETSIEADKKVNYYKNKISRLDRELNCMCAELSDYGIDVEDLYSEINLNKK